MFFFNINPDDVVPIYAQLVRQVRMAVLSGQLEPGEKLPSQRELARELVINHLTVKKAYDVLESRGLVESRRGLGTFVVESIPPGVGEKDRRDFREELGRVVALARGMGISREELEEELRICWDE